MYGIFTNICLKNHPNVGKHIIHGAYGYSTMRMILILKQRIHRETTHEQMGDNP